MGAQSEHKCSICGKIFITEAALKEHVKEEVITEEELEANTKNLSENAESAIDDYKAKLQDLASLFAEGKISQESYLLSVKTIEEKMGEIDKTKEAIQKFTAFYEEGKISKQSYKISIEPLEKKLGNRDKLEKSPGVGLPPSKPVTYEESLYNSQHEEPSRYNESGSTLYKGSYNKQRLYQDAPGAIWYLLPLFFGLLGALIGYVGVKDRDPDMANNILLLGIAITIIGVLFIWAEFAWLMSIISS